MYRIVDTTELDAGQLVTVRTFLDPIEAQLSRARLEACNIAALVVEPTGFNPLLTAAAGGVQLRVREIDAGRAESILRTTASDDDDDDEPEGSVRCPRCELAYCFHERPTMRTAGPAGIGLIAYVAGRLGNKRWYCHKCEHVWDDAAAGPSQRTALGPTDPSPVFRLRRAHGALGLFVGLVGGLGVELVAHSSVAAIGAATAAVAGWLIGRAVGTDVCSDPSCRAPLRRDAEECARCRGAIAGAVERAADHYAETANFRRELAALRAGDEARRKRKKPLSSRRRPAPP